ncbi:MAG: hypothetical protein H0X30_01000 [Anaerolineae bacterium]|nr:hypothetical protein [Anaerolineae bacterium]
MNDKKDKANYEVTIKCDARIPVKLAVLGVIYFWGINLAIGTFQGFSLIMWIWIVIVFLLSPMDVGFSDNGIVIEKFGRQIFFPWEEVVLVTRSGGIIKIYGSGKSLTRYERLITNTISITPLTNRNYKDAAKLIGEKVGYGYKRW